MRKRGLIGLLRDRGRGVASLEFALIFPVMVTMMFGVVDASDGLIAYRRVTVAAESVAVIGTELSVQNDGTTNLTPTQAYQAATAIFGVMPGMLASGTSSFSVTLSAVVFTATPTGCTPGVDCTYTANVAWSAAPLFSTGGLGQNVTRACGTLTQTLPTAPQNLTTIPTLNVTSPSAVLIADVSYTFVPLFTRVFVGPQTFQHSAYLPPRLGPPTQYITYNVAAPTTPPVCKGYL